MTPQEESQQLVFEARVREKFHGFAMHRYSKLQRWAWATIAVLSLAATGLAGIDESRAAAMVMFVGFVILLVVGSLDWRSLTIEHAMARAEAFRMRRLAEQASMGVGLSDEDVRRKLEEAYATRSLLCRSIDVDMRHMARAHAEVEQEMGLTSAHSPSHTMGA